MNDRTLLGLSTLFLLSACSGQDVPSPLALGENEGSRIIGGVEVAFDDPIASTVVGLYDTARRSVCTGSFIGQNLVLTAAHCVTGPPSNLVVVFGLDVFGFRTGSAAARPVLDAELNPLWDKHQGKSTDVGDIALVKFAGAAPYEYRPARLLERLDSIADGDTVTLAGYGFNNGLEKSGNGRLHKVDVQIEKLHYAKTEFLVDQTTGRGACHGDSGSPAYATVDGEMFVLGITSRPVNDPKGTCGVSVAYTSVPAYAGWLRTAAKKLNSRRPPTARRSHAVVRDARPLPN